MSIVTDSIGLREGWVGIRSGSHTVHAYRSIPEGGQPHPIVLVMHQIYGVNDYTRDVCRRFSKAGFLALVPDLYGRYGSPQGKTKDEIRQGLALAVDDTDVLEDIAACSAWCSQEGGDSERSGIVGFAWGGQFVWLACAELPHFRAGVSWYGRLVREPNEKRPRPWREVAAGLRAPVLGIFAGADPGISKEDLGEMRRALTSASVPTEFILYPDAIHGFHADYQPFYRPDDANDAWRRQMAWFASHCVC